MKENFKKELFNPINNLFLGTKTVSKWLTPKELLERKPFHVNYIDYSKLLMEACKLPYSRELRDMDKAKRGWTSDPKILETLPNITPQPLANAFKNQNSQVVNLRTLLPEE